MTMQAWSPDPGGANQGISERMLSGNKVPENGYETL